MKKILATVLGVVFAMFAFAGCNMAAADGTATGASGITSIVMMVVIIAVFYFLMIVPEKKRKKKAQEMRDSIEVGDKIVTIGGMVGKVVHVTGDKLTFETGEDRVRIEIAKWGIQSTESMEAAAAQKGGKKSKKNEEKKEEPKPKFQTEALQCASSFNGLTSEQVKVADQQEKEMLKKDMEIRARNHAKNELESYIYNMRDKVTDVYKAYVLDNVRDAFLEKLEKTESWLYDDEGYYAKREAFESRLTELQTIGNPIVLRYKDSQERPEAVSQLTQRLETIERILSTPNEKYDHITEEEKKPVRDLIAESQSWLQKMLVEQSNLALTQDPVLRCADILDRMKNVDALYKKVISKPKPAPKKEEKKPEEKKEEKKDSASDNEEKMEEEKPEEKKEEKSEEKEKMDVE